MRLLSKKSVRHGSGFTLLEIIVAITASAVLAVILVQYFSVSSGRSWQPIDQLQQRLRLQSIMDQITSDYRNLLLSAPQPLVALEGNIDDGDYWDEADNVQVVVNECIEFVQEIAGQWREDPANDPCVHPGDTLLKVTLSLGNQTLTTIFAR